MLSDQDRALIERHVTGFRCGEGNWIADSQLKAIIDAAREEGRQSSGKSEAGTKLKKAILAALDAETSDDDERHGHLVNGVVRDCKAAVERVFALLAPASPADLNLSPLAKKAAFDLIRRAVQADQKGGA